MAVRNIFLRVHGAEALAQLNTLIVIPTISGLAV